MNATEQLMAAVASTADLTGAVNTTWLLVAGFLVFFMQAGFGMLEAGVVRAKNVTNIMFKNLMDAIIAALVFSLIGYGIAYGDADDGGFIGAANFALTAEDGTTWAGFFFQWTFSAAAATIVSGAVAERCNLDAYFIYSVFLTGFTYPVVVHWVWDTEGWLCSWAAEPKFLEGNGMVDFAGCSVVHMVGGFAGLVGAIMLGPRKGRFTADGNPADFEPHNKLTAAVGVMFLWFGWYGFNCGSTLMMSGGAYNTAAKCAVTTTLAAAAGGMTATIYSRVVLKHYEIMLVLNGILAGLVSITAGCAFMKPGWSIVAGMIGCLICIGSSNLLKKLKIDDPLDACPVHGFTGMWGALAVGIFCSDEDLGLDGVSAANGIQFVTQLIGVLVICLWTVVNAALMFFVIKKTVGLRVSEEKEIAGLDKSEHGGAAYAGIPSDEATDPTVTPADVADKV